MSIFKSLSSIQNCSIKSNKSFDFILNNNVSNQTLNESSRWNPRESVVFVKQGGKDRIAA